MYGACVRFYEEVKRNNKMLSVPTNYETVFIPKCICIISHYNFYAGYLKFLYTLYELINTPNNRIPIEKYISHFMHEIPLPLCGHPGVLYNIGRNKIIFKLAQEYRN